MIFKIQYPSEIFGLEEQNGGVWQRTIVMQWPKWKEYFLIG